MFLVVVLVGTWEEVGVLKKIGCQWFIDISKCLLIWMMTSENIKPNS